MMEQMEEAAALVAKAAGVKKDEALSGMGVPKDQFGDISSRVAFLLAKERKENPAKLAAEIAAKISGEISSKTGGKGTSFSKVEAAGPYINFYIADAAYGGMLGGIVKKGAKYGTGKKSRKKALLEYPSVNPNKPWHVGHLRNALLGDSVARILSFSGMGVERIDYIDDLGLQVAQSLWGYVNLSGIPEGKFDTWLGTQYVEVSRRAGSDEAVAAQVREYLKKIEEGDNETAVKGRELAELCVGAQYQTAFSYGVHHDALVFESDIMRNVFVEGIELLKKSNAVVQETEGKNKGCWVVKLSGKFEEEFGEMRDADKVLIRSDGTAVYTGKDVIFHLWKFGKLKGKLKYEPFVKQPDGSTAYKSSPKLPAKAMGFGNADIVVNVIGQEQKYPQRVIVEVLRMLGYDKEADGLVHLAYEHVGLPEEKFSGRAGTWVGYTADELLAESKKRVVEKIKGEMPEEDKKAVVDAVGAGAIKFAFLKTSADKKITFKWEEALNMEGDSGPYIQYAFVRTRGILGKADEAGVKPAVAKGHAFNEAEKILLKRLSAFPDIVQRCARDHAPHQACQYLLDVAGEFSRFYNASPVLKAETKEAMGTRLAIVQATNGVLASGLSLLGMERPERM